MEKKDAHILSSERSEHIEGLPTITLLRYAARKQLLRMCNFDIRVYVTLESTWTLEDF
jgi:hypothetical protein